MVKFFITYKDEINKYAGSTVLFLVGIDSGLRLGWIPFLKDKPAVMIVFSVFLGIVAIKLFIKSFIKIIED